MDRAAMHGKLALHYPDCSAQLVSLSLATQISRLLC